MRKPLPILSAISNKVAGATIIILVSFSSLLLQAKEKQGRLERELQATEQELRVAGFAYAKDIEMRQMLGQSPFDTLEIEEGDSPQTKAWKSQGFVHEPICAGGRIWTPWCGCLPPVLGDDC